jgi:hypothetical protein
MKKYKLSTDNRQHFPLSFDYISYWNLDEEEDTERIDNYDDPFFDGISSEKYQTSACMPSSHFKLISKTLDLTFFDNKKPNE